MIRVILSETFALIAVALFVAMIVIWVGLLS
jgi:hypothetical protein